MKSLALYSLALSIATSFIPTQGQDPWKRYRPRTLDQIIKDHAAKVLDNPDILMSFPDGSTAVLTRDSFPSKVKGVLAENEREKCKKGPLALASERRAA